jgi:hypothetical protein
MAKTVMDKQTDRWLENVENLQVVARKFKEYKIKDTGKNKIMLDEGRGK